MIPRSLLVSLGVLFACVAALPGTGASRAADPAAGPGAIPADVKSDHLLFAHLRAKDVRDSALFAEVKQALTKADGAKDWELIEGQISKEIGVKPTELDTVTACVTEIPDRGEAKFILILASSKLVTKDGVFGLKPGARPDARGFYPTSREVFVHFPDDKTVVLLHADLAQKYLDGYAKNRAGWPLTADLSKAAAGHTAFVSLRLDKLPAGLKRERDFREFAPLMAARTVTLTADLKGKQVSVAARATFVNATAAGKARHKAHALVGLLGDEVDHLLGRNLPNEYGPVLPEALQEALRWGPAAKAANDLGAVLPAVKEVERMLAAVGFDVDGSDLTASAAYKTDFDFGTMVVEAVKRSRASAARMTAANNFKQVVLALHNYADSNFQIVIHGTGPKGRPLQKANEKPLLSWRVAILPYIEQDNLYKQFKFDEPWDSENNKKLIEKMPKVYAPVGRPTKPGHTHMQMVVGPAALQPGMRFPASFSDGTSNTVALVEAAEAVIWTKPDDVMLPEREFPRDFRKRFGGQFPGGFTVAMWDGSVRFVPDSVSDRTLAAALTPAGGEILGDDW